MLMNFGCASIGIQYKNQSQLTPNMSHLVYVQEETNRACKVAFKNEGINDNITIMLSAGSGKGNFILQCHLQAVLLIRRLFSQFIICHISTTTTPI